MLNGTRTPDDALDAAKLPSEVITATQDLTTKTMDANTDVRKNIDLLADYNGNIYPNGVPAGAAMTAQEWLGSGDGSNLVRYDYKRFSVKKANAMLPSGPASDVDVTRADSTVVPSTASTEVLQQYIYGSIKADALYAAQLQAQSQWMTSRLGNMNGFVEDWQSKINNPNFRQSVYNKAGVPLKADFSRKERSWNN